MNRRDEELLAKQMRTMAPPRNDGVIALMVAAVFLVGFVLGGSFFAPRTPTPATDGVYAAYGAPATLQR